jgi:hypothetical protein
MRQPLARLSCTPCGFTCTAFLERSNVSFCQTWHVSQNSPSACGQSFDLDGCRGSLENAIAAGTLGLRRDKLRVYRSIAMMDKLALIPAVRNRKPTWLEAVEGGGSSMSSPMAWTHWQHAKAAVSSTYKMLRRQSGRIGRGVPPADGGARDRPCVRARACLSVAARSELPDLQQLPPRKHPRGRHGRPGQRVKIPR